MSSEKLKTYTENLTNEVKNGANAVVPVIESKVEAAKNIVDGAVNNVYKAVDTAFGNSNLAKLEERFFNVKSIKKADVVIQEAEKDWRLRLSLPSSFRKQASQETDLLAPLIKTNGMVFPYTPTVLVSQSANYQQIQPVHTNYPYYSYQNSQVDQMTITADFYVQNAAEARYWVACIHYLSLIHI